jgi:hypothetical protein
VVQQDNSGEAGQQLSYYTSVFSYYTSLLSYCTVVFSYYTRSIPSGLSQSSLHPCHERFLSINDTPQIFGISLLLSMSVDQLANERVTDPSYYTRLVRAAAQAELDGTDHFDPWSTWTQWVTDYGKPVKRSRTTMIAHIKAAKVSDDPSQWLLPRAGGARDGAGRKRLKIQSKTREGCGGTQQPSTVNNRPTMTIRSR